MHRVPFAVACLACVVNSWRNRTHEGIWDALKVINAVPRAQSLAARSGLNECAMTKDPMQALAVLLIAAKPGVAFSAGDQQCKGLQFPIRPTAAVLDRWSRLRDVRPVMQIGNEDEQSALVQEEGSPVPSDDKTSSGRTRRGLLSIITLGLPFWAVSRGFADEPDSFKAITKEIYAAAQPSRSATILELGAQNCNSVFEDHYRMGDEVTGIDIEMPKESVIRDAEYYAETHGFRFRFEQGDATKLSRFPDESFDAVVCTFTLCSVASVEAAVAEIQRVLKPGGRFGFVEHVRTRDEDGQPLLNVVNTLLDPPRSLLTGCHLQRDTDRIIVDAFGGSSSVARLQRMVSYEMFPAVQQAAGVVIKT